MQHGILLSLTLLAIAGCHLGTQVEEFQVAQRPAGIESAIVIDDRTLTGELIEVRDSGLVLLSPWRDQDDPDQTSRRLLFIPYGALSNASFAQIRSVALSLRGQPPEESVRKRLQLLSRFPQGLSARLVSELLVVHGQREIEVVER